MSKKNLPTIELVEFKPEEMPLSCTWIIIGAPGSGKCVKKDTPILLYDGSIKMVQDIITGDLLMGDDSTPRRVLSTTTGRDKMYKITRVDSRPYISEESYTVNEPHILSLLDSSSSIRKVVDISVEDYLRLTENRKAELKGYRTYFDTPENPKAVRNEQLMNVLRKVGREFNGVFFVALDDRGPNGKNTAKKLVLLARSCGFTTRLSTIGDNHYEVVIDTANVGPSDVTDGYPISVEYVGVDDYYGFELDGNHRFLLGDFTVTHNTSFMENMAYYRKHLYPTARVFIGTEDGYKRMCKIFHPLFVSNYWDEEEAKKHVMRQKTCEMENGRGYPGNYAVLIIDDVSDDPKIYKTKLMRGLFKLGSQHWAQLAMIGSQYAIDMPPDVRKAVSYVALAREPEEIERKKLYENFGGMAGSYARFCDLMDQVTGDYTFLIFKKRSQSNELEDCVSWFRTKKMGDWKFGSKEYRSHGDSRYDPKYVEQLMM